MISPLTSQDALKQASMTVSSAIPIRESLILPGPMAAVRQTIAARQAMIARPEEVAAQDADRRDGQAEEAGRFPDGQVGFVRAFMDEVLHAFFLVGKRGPA